jgi:hypothetical protein
MRILIDEDTAVQLVDPLRHARTFGGVIAAMPMIVHELQNASGQRLVMITAVDPRRRYEITDPGRIPPSPYWPR